MSTKNTSNNVSELVEPVGVEDANVNLSPEHVRTPQTDPKPGTDSKGSNQRNLNEESKSAAIGDRDGQSNRDRAEAYSRLLTWWKLTNERSRDSDLAIKIQQLREHGAFLYYDTLNSVINELDIEIKLRETLAGEFSGVKRTGRRISNFQIGLIPWRELLWETPMTHAAIDMPISEPDLSEPSLTAYSNGSMTEARFELQDTSQNLLSLLGELPERIRINSGRLQGFLEYACHTSYDWKFHNPPKSSVHLLRPFKLLIVFQEQIRARVKEVEEARWKVANLSEDQYLVELENSPAYDDEDARNYEGPSKLGLSKLTALINDCRCLLRFMDELLLPEHKRIFRGPENIKFEDLWHLFPVGTLVYSRDEMVPHKIWRILQTSGGRRLLSYTGVHRQTVQSADMNDRLVKHLDTPRYSDFRLECFYIDYDGTRHIQISHIFSVPRFEGWKALENLPIIPLSVAEKIEGLFDRNSVVSRGRQFLKCRLTSHLYYSGRTLGRAPNGTRLRVIGDRGDLFHSRTAHLDSVRVESEVVVDFARTCQSIPEWKPGYSADYNAPIKEGKYKTHDTTMDTDIAEWDERLITGQRNWVTERDSRWDSQLRMAFWQKEEPKRRLYEAPVSEAQAEQGEIYKPPDDDDEFFLLLPDRVFAFVLRTRRWACLRLSKGLDGSEGLVERKARPEPWDDLKLPGGHKELVQSLIDSHFSINPSMKTNFDLVREKGNGIIILLHGVPGVGKTSTAGDLGLTPDSVEERLQEMFRIAHAWGCILLLDEADVFLAHRNPSDMKRNSLVSVFLRTLEYYEGVLFLTTNRAGVFDEAFKSRIHMSLYYPALDESQTFQIWDSHASKAMKAGVYVNKDELTTFAGEMYKQQQEPQFGPIWNGRQIRNVFKSALALAGFHTKSGETIRLEKKYFQQVFNTSHKFSSYMLRVHMGQTDADFAKMGMFRRDDYVDDLAHQGLVASSIPSTSSQSAFGRNAQNVGMMASFGLPAQPPPVSMPGNMNFASMANPSVSQYGQVPQPRQYFHTASPPQNPESGFGLGQGSVHQYHHLSQQNSQPQIGSQQIAYQMSNPPQQNMGYSAALGPMQGPAQQNAAQQAANMPPGFTVVGDNQQVLQQHQQPPGKMAIPGSFQPPSSDLEQVHKAQHQSG